MFFEITLIQRLMLFLGYPDVLADRHAGVAPDLHRHRRAAERAAAGPRGPRRSSVLLGAIAAAHGLLPVRPAAADRRAARPARSRPGSRSRSCVLAPLGVCLGIVHAARARRGRRPHASTRREYVAWGWAVNGFASVVGSVLTTILAMTFGFRVVLVVALVRLPRRIRRAARPRARASAARYRVAHRAEEARPMTSGSVMTVAAGVGLAAAGPARGRDRASARWRYIENAIFAVLVYVPILLMAPGKVESDTKSYLYLDPGRLLDRATTLWTPQRRAGRDEPPDHRLPLPDGSVLLGPRTGSGCRDWIAQRLWLGTHHLSRRPRGPVPAADPRRPRHRRAESRCSSTRSRRTCSGTRRSTATLARARGPRCRGGSRSWCSRCGRAGGSTRRSFAIGRAAHRGAERHRVDLRPDRARDVAARTRCSSPARARCDGRGPSCGAPGCSPRLTSLWWVVSLSVEGEYGLNLLRFTESIRIVSVAIAARPRSCAASATGTSTAATATACGATRGRSTRSGSG